MIYIYILKTVQDWDWANLKVFELGRWTDIQIVIPS